MGSKILILNFHRISDEHSPAYPPIPVKVFDQILGYLKKRFSIIPLEEVHYSSSGKKSRLVITFDDAYLDFYENALPLLVKYNIPAVQNIITQCAESGKPMWTQRLNKLVEAYFHEKREVELSNSGVIYPDEIRRKDTEGVALLLYRRLLDNLGREEILTDLSEQLGTKYKETKMMRWQHIREAMEKGVNVGSHTHNHQNLTLIKEEQLKFELEYSAQLIKEKTGMNPSVVAFPNGQYNQRVVEAAKKTGYQYLLAVDEKSYKPRKNASEDAVILPRFNIYNVSFWKSFLRLNYYAWFK